MLVNRWFILFTGFKELKEGSISMLAKIVAVGVTGLAGISAQANQQLGETLARCSGASLSASALMVMAGKTEVANYYAKIGKEFIELSKRFIPANQADRIGAERLREIKQGIDQNDERIMSGVAKQISDCAGLISNASSSTNQSVR
jgi:hypothetical protein